MSASTGPAPAPAPATATAPAPALAPAPAAAAVTTSRLRATALDLPPSALAVLAEGAWIAVLYTLMQAARDEPLVLGPPGLAAFAAVGLVTARAVADRLGGRWPAVALGLVVLGAIAGWLLDSGVRGAIARGDIGAAAIRHQAGFLAGLALLRGAAHAVPATSERSLARLLTWGTPLLAIPLLIGRALDEPARSDFEAQALVDCLVFLVAGSLGLAVGRVARLGRAGGFAWSRNRAWLALAAGAAIVAAVALPTAFIAGPTVRLVVAIALPPLLLVAVVASVSQITLRTIGIVTAVGLLVFVLSRLGLNFVPNLTPGPTTSTLAGPNAQDPTATVITWLPIIALLVVLMLLLLRRWMRRRPVNAPTGVLEERWTDPMPAWTSLLAGLRRGWRRRGGASGPPADAVEAYLLALRDLGTHPDLARREAETPAGHARRLRRDGAGLLPLDLLVADYELARFGGRALTPREHARAINRWRRLRRRVAS